LIVPINLSAVFHFAWRSSVLIDKMRESRWRDEGWKAKGSHIRGGFFIRNSRVKALQREAPWRTDV